MSETVSAAGWRGSVPAGLRPYTERAALAGFFVGVSSGFPYTMLGATLTSRLAQDGIDKKAVTTFTLAFLAYNLKWLWAWLVDGVALPGSARYGRRVTWLLLAGALVIVAQLNLAWVDPRSGLAATAIAAVLLGVAGATYDIVIDAYRIELLRPEQLGVGAGMSQYGWRIGATLASTTALIVAGSAGWQVAYAVCAIYALPAMITALVMGEPARHRTPSRRKGVAEAFVAIIGPLTDFFRRTGAWLVMLFILLHKIGDTLANLTVRLLFNDLGYSNAEIAIYDVGFGFWGYLVGIFIGGILYDRMGLKRSVLLSLWLMGLTNLSFAGLAATHTNSDLALAGAMGFEALASGIGGVTVVAYFSALCDLRFTAAQYAMISAAASVVGRIITGNPQFGAGAMIDRLGYVDFYLLTTVAALPGIALFWWMARSGLVDSSIGSAGIEPAEPQSGD